MNIPPLREQLAGSCGHYRSPVNNDSCEAGVNYDELVKVKELGFRGSALRKPCIRSNHEEANRRGQPLCSCPHLRWKTEEEIDKEEKAIKDALERAFGKDR